MFFAKLFLRSTFPCVNRIQCRPLITSKEDINPSTKQPQTFQYASNKSLNELLIDATLNNQSTAPIASFVNLLNQLNSNANVQLPYVLPYDHVKRTNSTAGYDLSHGVVAIAHILPANHRVVFASGFAILNGQLIVTCAHPFYQAAQHIPSIASDQKSQTVAITQDGELIRIAEVASHLVDSDLVILRLENGRQIPPLSVDPYPAPISTPILSYDSAQLSLSFIQRPSISYVWKSAEVLYYKDRCGQEAATGTYDELCSMIYSHSPSNGSSGGPIIAAENNCVVGIVRGNEINYGHRKLTGFAVPSERLFEAFRLPGIPDEMQ